MAMQKMRSGNVIGAPTNFPAVEQYARTVAGLPLRVAVTYALLFTTAFWLYATLWPNAPIMVPDSGTYLRAAQDFSNFRISELHDRAPGYPLLLLVTRSTEAPNRLLFLASLSLHFGSIWLLATVLYRCGLKEMMLILFASILLLPPYVEYAGYVLSENLTEAMLVAGFVTLVFGVLSNRPIWLVLSASTIACAALTRPTYELLGVAIAGYLLATTFTSQWARTRWKELLKASVTVLSASILLLGGYSYLNYRSVGYFGLTTPLLGQHLTQKTFRVIERLPDEHAAVRESLIASRNLHTVNSESYTAYDYIFTAMPELTRITGLQKGELSEYLLRINLMLIQKAPLQYLQEVVWAFASYWFPSSGDLANLGSRFAQLLWAIIHFLLIGGFFLILLLLGGPAIYVKMCLRTLPQARRKFLTAKLEPLLPQAFTYGLAAIFVFYTAVITCLIQVGIPRYRVPTDVLIVFMLFVGAHVWQRLLDASRLVLCDTESHRISR